MSFFSDQTGGGAPTASLKLHHIGDTRAGVIESINMVDKKAYGTDTTEVDAAGNPVKQLKVVISGQPDNYASASKGLIDDNGQPIPDDGRRAIYIALNTNLSFRTAEALQALGPQYLERGLEVGGQFGVRYVEDIPTNKGNPARGHQVFYKPPAQSSGAMFATQAQPQQAQPQQPAPQGPPPGFAQQPQQPAPQGPPPGFAQQPQGAPFTQSHSAPAPQPQGAWPPAQPQQPAPQGPPPGFAQQPPAQPQGAPFTQSHSAPAPQPQAAPQGAWPPAQQQQAAPSPDPWQAQPQGYSAEPPF